jgi:hypothetical protein
MATTTTRVEGSQSPGPNLPPLEDSHISQPRRHTDITIPITPVVPFSGTPIARNNYPPEEQEADHTYLLVPTALQRRKVSEDATMSQRRAEILQLMHDRFPDPSRLPNYSFPAQAEELVKPVLDLLEETLVGVPVQGSESELRGYILRLGTYNHVLLLLNGYLDRAQSVLDSIRIPLPQLPQWNDGENPSIPWSAADFEMLCVLFRDDVENFFGYLYHHRALLPEAQSDPQAPGYRHQRFKRSSAFSQVLPDISDNSSNPMESTRIQPNPVRDVRNVELDPVPSNADGFDAAHRRQSTTIFGGQNPFRSNIYTSHPTQMAQSNRLSELFENPNPGPNPHNTQSSRFTTPRIPNPFRRERQSNWPLASTFHRQNNNRGGGPPDDDNSDPSDPDSDHEDRNRSFQPRNFGSSIPARTLVADNELHFEVKLKHDIVPIWDGDPDTLAKWVLKINQLA